MSISTHFPAAAVARLGDQAVPDRVRDRAVTIGMVLVAGLAARAARTAYHHDDIGLQATSSAASPGGARSGPRRSVTRSGRLPCHLAEVPQPPEEVLAGAGGQEADAGTPAVP